MLDYKKVLMVYEKYWKKAHFTSRAEKLTEMLNLLRERAKENGDKLSGVSVAWPDDFDGDEDTFWIFIHDFENQTTLQENLGGIKIVFK